MKRNWLVVANSARARVLVAGDEPGRFEHLSELVHPRSREKGVDLARLDGGDRPGHVEGVGHGLGSAAYQPRTDPRRREREHFAREVAGVVNAAVADGRCAGVTLVASASFLGLIKAALSEQAHKHLQHALPHDYTLLSDEELGRRLGLRATAS